MYVLRLLLPPLLLLLCILSPRFWNTSSRHPPRLHVPLRTQARSSPLLLTNRPCCHGGARVCWRRGREGQREIDSREREGETARWHTPEMPPDSNMASRRHIHTYICSSTVPLSREEPSPSCSHHLATTDNLSCRVPRMIFRETTQALSPSERGVGPEQG